MDQSNASDAPLSGPDQPDRVVNATVVWLAAYVWRLLVIAIGVAALLWFVGALWVTFLSLLLALLLWRALSPVVGWLRKHGWGRTPAALGTLLGFLIVVIAIFAVVGVSVSGQAGKIGTTVTEGVDRIENWVVDDAPIDVSRQDVANFREGVRDTATKWLRSSESSVVAGVIVGAQVVVGIGIGLIITFFALKDGDRFARWAQGLLPQDRREPAQRLAASAWSSVGGYLRGAALLGVVEGIVIGAAVALAGGSLAVVVAVFTFVMAFVPFIGAFVAGALAVLVTLATGGTVPALIVLAVVLVVQELDHDLLSPVIYGKALDIHPVVVLVSVTAGGSLFGVVGSVLAVLVVAVAISVGNEALQIRREAREPPSAQPG